MRDSLPAVSSAAGFLKHSTSITLTHVASMHLYQLSDELAVGLTPSGTLCVYDIGVIDDLDDCETADDVADLLDGSTLVELDEEETESLFNILKLHFTETSNETIQ